jgi:hypothetical protein
MSMITAIRQDYSNKIVKSNTESNWHFFDGEGFDTLQYFLIDSINTSFLEGELTVGYEGD